MSGLAQGGLQKKAWRWQPEDGAAHCQFASPSSNQPTKPTSVVTHGNAISYSLRGTPRCCPLSSRVQLPGRRFNGPAKNTRSGAGSSINYLTMECDGPFVVFHLECSPPGDARSNAVDRLPGFASGMGCSSRERKTKHNNPAMDSGFPSGPGVARQDDELVKTRVKANEFRDAHDVLEPAAVCIGLRRSCCTACFLACRCVSGPSTSHSDQLSNAHCRAGSCY